MNVSLCRCARLARLALVLLLRFPADSPAQAWRTAAASLGPTTRVLIVGARPEDEDNALIAWLSLGRNIETAYLSLTRGESAQNLAGTERQAGLAVVRTAELLAERERDGARQFFTRAYDFGPTRSDSVVGAGWPHDSLLRDVVSVVRAFRPHVIVLAFSDSGELDATRRAAAQLAREAFSAAADSIRLPAAATSRLPAWTVSRLYTPVAGAADGVLGIDVGEFDRESGRSFAELGAEIRRLQRSQPAPPAPLVGHLRRWLRLDSTRVGGDATRLFGSMDTSWARLKATSSANVHVLLDSLTFDIAEARTLAARGSPDSLTVALARVIKHMTDLRLAMPCGDISGVPGCSGTLGDLAVSLNTTRAQAVHALIGAAGLVIDGTVARELVAAGDSVPVAVTVFNGGKSPLTIRRLAATSRSNFALLVRDSTVVQPDSIAHWSANVRVISPSHHWWQIHGLVSGTWLHVFSGTSRNPVISELINGEDRIESSGVEATLAFGGIDVSVIERPLVYRPSNAVRGDLRHPLAGVTPLSVLLERSAEYERADLPIDRLFRVFLSSAQTQPDTVAVTIRLPVGLKADSARRVVVVPPLGSRNVFFRLRGRLTPRSDSVNAIAERVIAPPSGDAPAKMRPFIIPTFNYGAISHDYPHIPSQQFVRFSNERLEAVDLRVPPRLRVAYVKGSNDIQSPLGQLQVNVQTLEPSLLSVVDLSWYTTVVIGSDAFANDALAGAVPSLVEFARSGGTVVVFPSGDDVARSGLLPFPIAFDSVPARISDPAAPIRVVDAKSQLLHWPNAITPSDFDNWITERARNIPSRFDPRYRTLLSLSDAGQPATTAAVLVAPVGRGVIVYTSLSLDKEVAAINPGAARLLVNFLAAGLRPAASK
jgi:LmbE family N-acetylglucosaminyl deacetylase